MTCLYKRRGKKTSNKCTGIIWHLFSPQQSPELSTYRAGNCPSPWHSVSPPNRKDAPREHQASVISFLIQGSSGHKASFWADFMWSHGFSLFPSCVWCALCGDSLATPIVWAASVPLYSSSLSLALKHSLKPELLGCFNLMVPMLRMSTAQWAGPEPKDFPLSMLP